jgi:hypothetical protein
VFWGGVVAWLSLTILRTLGVATALDLSAGLADLGGHPVAQATPGRRGLAASRCAMETRRASASQSRRVQGGQPGRRRHSPGAGSEILPARGCPSVAVSGGA